MKLWGIFRFELAYQARRAWPWLFCAVLLAVAFLMARDNALADALYEEFLVNSPFAIAKTTVFGSLVWLLLAAPIAGEAAAREVATRMHPLVYTASIGRAEYVGGRFLAALALNALLLLAVQAGILLAVHSPGVDAALVGPFRPAAYLTTYAVVALPTAFAATAIQFAFALRSGRPMASYSGSLLLVFLGFFVAGFLLFHRGVGTLVDPIGIRFVVEDLAHRWTTAERNVRLVGLEGPVLANRLLWLGVGIATLAAASLRFRFAHRVERVPRWRRTRRAGAGAAARGADAAASAPVAAPRVARTFGAALDARRTLAVAWISFRTIAASWTGLVLLVVIPLLTVLVVIDQMVSNGAPLAPTTARVLSELTAPLSAELSRWVIVPLLIAFFAGELVWRERDARVSEIADAMPGSEWAPFLGKLLGLAGVLAAFMAMLTGAGIVAQALRGHREFEVVVYLQVLFGLQLPEYLLFAVLALVVHVVVNQKYVGHLVTILVYTFVAVLATMLGIEHNLLVYGAAPGWSYSDMRGFGPSVGPWAWFKLYWAAWALVLAVAARLLWVRGRAGGPRTRLRLARSRLAHPATRYAGLAGVGLVLALGGFVFYNTNVLHEYLSTAAIDERRAEYERRYRRYEGALQPRLAATTLHVELFPTRRAAEIRGSYRLVNGGARAIDSIHVATAGGGVETRTLTFDRAAALVLDDATLGFQVYALERPLAPGDTLRLAFAVHVEPRGFRNRGVDQSIVANGSHFTNGAWFPRIGYQRQRELVSAAARREHGLEPRPVIASLHETEGREPTARGGGIAFEAVVGTEEDQIAVAPGALRRTWTNEGRRYFRYVADAPIGGQWEFFSARYAVREGRWNPDTRADSVDTPAGQAVAIRIHHDPEHTGHLDRVMRGVQASLSYLTAQFGPYPYRQLSVVESGAGLGTGMHAEASMISHGQGFAFWAPEGGGHGLDFPYAVVAHEMAHQWTLPYAMVEGAPFLSEGLAWYAAMQVVKASRGDAQLRQLLSFMRQPYPYPPIRRGEPLLRALDPYLSYRRGPFAMYALSEYVGADRVNGALRRLIEKHDAPGAPLVTTLDLYRELRSVTPDSLHYLLHDLFEVNTLWQLAASRATAVQAGDGEWQVTLDVRARKVVYDSTGTERDAPMDDWVPIGVFGAGEQGAGESPEPIYLRMHRVRAGEQTITVTVPRRPIRAGIDPDHLLEWEANAVADNVVDVSIP